MKSFTVQDLLDLDALSHPALRCVAGEGGTSRIIGSRKIYRPGLALSGYFEGFSSECIQLMGRTEEDYLAKSEERGEYGNIERIFSLSVPCLIFIGGYTPSNRILSLADRTNTPILTTDLESNALSVKLFSVLSDAFAETITIHGVLMEVCGIGVLITGESGIGKSEAALDLMSRGHLLISDDSVKLKKIFGDLLLGSGENPILAHHMEIRGLGIIDITNLFGVGVIKERKEIQMEIHLEAWDDSRIYDRLGESCVSEYLGIEIPKIVLPIRPGRNVALLIETAARNERLKGMGYSSFDAFENSIKEWLGVSDD